jgi:hypothetical protein
MSESFVRAEGGHGPSFAAVNRPTSLSIPKEGKSALTDTIELIGYTVVIFAVLSGVIAAIFASLSYNQQVEFTICTYILLWRRR